MIYAGIGSRETPPHVLEKMEQVARILSGRNCILRSGGAPGADSAFERGATEKEIFLPWPKFQNNPSPFSTPSKAAYDLAQKYHPAWGKLSDSSKHLMARNSHQVLGQDLKTPCEIVICWTNDGLASGGTGQAIRMATDLCIPVMNLYHCSEDATPEEIVADIDNVVQMLAFFSCKEKDITEFIDEYRWLSNFWPAPVTYEGVMYPSVENAYQAAKAANPKKRACFTSCHPGEAKKKGRLLQIRQNWDDIKLEVMRELITQKFDAGTELADRLIKTGTRNLVEGNTWGDIFWGVCRGSGQNNLGKLLMAQRDSLIKNTPPSPASSPENEPFFPEPPQAPLPEEFHEVLSEPPPLAEEYSDIWNAYPDKWVCITTNGVVKEDGSAVMGAGIAKEAADRFPGLPGLLGKYLKEYGNRCFIFKSLHIISFPTKEDWKEKSNVNLIQKSCGELMAIVEKYNLEAVALPRPGCGKGGLDWPTVKEIITPLLRTSPRETPRASVVG